MVLQERRSRKRGLFFVERLLQQRNELVAHLRADRGDDKAETENEEDAVLSSSNRLV